MRITDDYYFFFRHKFGQWTRADIHENGIKFNCNEQFMMYKKAMLFGDHETAKKILETENPKTQKRLGREVKNFIPAVWDENKYLIVLRGNFLKFTQHTELKERLIATGNRLLVEASPYDNIWGIGLGYDDDRVLDQIQWKGANLLGIALTEVRDTLRMLEGYHFTMD
jgi:ribA/ribD-fused uncharacterized protein